LFGIPAFDRLAPQQKLALLCEVGVTVHWGLSQFSQHTGEYTQWVNGSGRENGTVPFACSGENSLRRRPVNAYEVGEA
jgi:hypothetical protein